MEVKIDRENETLIASVAGRIDGVTAREFEDKIKSAIKEDDGTVIIDMDAVSYVSSAGLRAILLIAKELQRRDAKFALCSLADPIYEIFSISGFNKIIKIHASRAEALTAAGG